MLKRKTSKLQAQTEFYWKDKKHRNKNDASRLSITLTDKEGNRKTTPLISFKINGIMPFERKGTFQQEKDGVIKRVSQKIIKDR